MEIKVQALIDAITAQRNKALDELAQLSAVNAALIEQLAERDAKIAELEKPSDQSDH